MSRFHGEVLLEPQGTIYRDKGSSNGSKINGVSSAVMKIEPGDTIQIGATNFRYMTG